MKTGWKALTSVAVTAALVFAPIVATGALADEGETTPPGEVLIVEETAPVEEAPAQEPVAEPAPVPEVVPEAVAPEPPAEVAAPVESPTFSEPVPETPAEPEVTTQGGDHHPKKVFVCKYVGIPGVNERLQTGDNPISVSVNAIPGGASIGAYFADQHGRSYVLAWDTGQGEPDVSECPPPTNEPCTQGDSGGPEDCLITPTLTWTPPTCDAPGTLTLSEHPHLVWSAVLNDDGSTTYTASSPQGPYYYQFPQGAQTQWTVPDLKQLPEDSDECSTVVVPPTVVITVDCEAESNIKVVATNPNALPVFVTLVLDFNLDMVPDASEVLTVVPGETVLFYDFAEDTAVGIAVLYGETPVYQDVVSVNCEGEPNEATLTPPVAVDECGTENDAYGLPEDSEGVVYSWEDESDPDNLNVIATVQDGYEVTDVPAGWVADGEGVYFYEFTFEFTDEECDLLPGDIGAVCVGDVPYLGYGVTLPEGFEADSDTPVTITFVNPDGDDYVVENQPLSGSLLWPGAATNPKAWPGYITNADGTYTATTGNFAWTREGVTVIFEVNPTYETVVEYPEASAECANPPANPPKPASVTTTTTGGLASTGGDDVPPILPISGAAILLLGLYLTVRNAIRKVRA